MFMLTLSDPTLHAALIRGQQARSQEMARAFYLALRAPSRLVAATGEAVRTVGAWLSRRRREQAAMATLRGMNDHMLADLGIGRSEIPAVVRSGERDLEDYRKVRPALRGGGRGRPTPGADWKQAA